MVGWSAADWKEFGPAKLGAVGRPHRGFELRTRTETGDIGGTDVVGELEIRSDAGLPADIVAAVDRVTADGWLRTGDLARIDADGFVWIEGRVSAMINRGGLKVFPDEVEERLRALDGVEDVAVAGVADDRLGEVPWAFVVGRTTLDELQAWCRATLAPYKIPVGVTVVDALPRNEMGKVLRQDLVPLAARRCSLISAGGAMASTRMTTAAVVDGIERSAIGSSPRLLHSGRVPSASPSPSQTAGRQRMSSRTDPLRRAGRVGLGAPETPPPYVLGRQRLSAQEYERAVAYWADFTLEQVLAEFVRIVDRVIEFAARRTDEEMNQTDAIPGPAIDRCGSSSAATRSSSSGRRTPARSSRSERGASSERATASRRRDRAGSTQPVRSTRRAAPRTTTLRPRSCSPIGCHRRCRAV